MDVLAAAGGSGGYDVALAALNVLQTVALAYLAASKHQDRNGRRDRRDGTLRKPE